MTKQIKQRPLIGISANFRDGTSCVAEAYYQAVIKAGGAPVILPLTDDEAVLERFVEGLDALVLSGGGDMAAHFFGQEHHPKSGEPNLLRDRYDLALTRLAANRQLPILGICRGMQVLNVAFGGTIFQDIADCAKPTISLRHSQTEARHITTHSVAVAEDSLLHTIVGARELSVNSFHHQAVDRIAEGFVATAFAPDGICEAIESKHYPILGVQWHPENLAVDNQAAHLALFEWVVARAALFSHAKTIHRQGIILDSHCDTPMEYTEGMDFGQRTATTKVDFVKMREGMLDATCMVAYIPQQPLDEEHSAAATKLAFDTLVLIHRQVEANADKAVIATTPDAIAAAKRAGKVAIVPALENGYALGDDLQNVERFYNLGVRYITLCHNGDNQICDSAARSLQTHNGLSTFGREVIAEMNRLGIAVDLSHGGEKSFWDALELSKKPIIVSHSSARALCDHPRNLTDAQLKALAEKGGVCQVCLYTHFLTKEGEADVQTAVAHINHIVAVAGIDHVGIGSDFDGGGELLGCMAANEFGNITVALIEAGYSDEEIQKIWGGNFLRVLRDIQDVNN